MNIDIVNKQVSNKLGIDEKKVALVNKFYWSRIKEHIHSCNPDPVNIESICVLYPDKYLVKKAILYYVTKIRIIKTSKKFRPDSEKQIEHIKSYTGNIKKFWAIRKTKKFIN